MDTLFVDLTPQEQINTIEDLEDEPETLRMIILGHYCAVCYMVSHNCLCSHDN